MEAAFPDALVTGYGHRTQTVTLVDADDQHVVAAAIEGKAAVLVTSNLRHFPTTVLKPLGIQVLHLDAFAARLYEAAPGEMVKTLRSHCARLTRPPKTALEYIETLQQNQMTQMTALLSQHVHDI